MAQALEVDLKQIVLASGPFGPQEIKQIVHAVAEDSSQYRTFRDAVAELEEREDRSLHEQGEVDVHRTLCTSRDAALFQAGGNQRIAEREQHRDAEPDDERRVDQAEQQEHLRLQLRHQLGLARGTFELLRSSGRKAVLKCPFMGEFFARHPEYADIVAG